MMGGMAFHLAQVNIARLLAPLDSEQLADFVAALGWVNATADEAPGFVWRLEDENGDATSIPAFAGTPPARTASSSTCRSGPISVIEASGFQDCVANSPFNCSGAANNLDLSYIEPNWPNVRVIDGENGYNAWGYPHAQNDVPASQLYYSGAWIGPNIVAGGPLGADEYTYGDGHSDGDPGYTQWDDTSQPKYSFVSEGDNVAYLGLINTGLRSSDPTVGGWEGRFQLVPGFTNQWTDVPGDIYNGVVKNVYDWDRWFPDEQNDFAARMLWGVQPARVDKVSEPMIRGHSAIAARPEQTASLRAHVLSPTGQQMTTQWSQYQDAGDLPRRRHGEWRWLRHRRERHRAGGRTARADDCSDPFGNHSGDTLDETHYERVTVTVRQAMHAGASGRWGPSTSCKCGPVHANQASVAGHRRLPVPAGRPGSARPALFATRGSRGVSRPQRSRHEGPNEQDRCPTRSPTDAPSGRRMLRAVADLQPRHDTSTFSGHRPSDSCRAHSTPCLGGRLLYRTAASVELAAPRRSASSRHRPSSIANNTLRLLGAETSDQTRRASCGVSRRAATRSGAWWAIADAVITGFARLVIRPRRYDAAIPGPPAEWLRERGRGYFQRHVGEA